MTQNENGRTMFEVLGILSIVAVLTVGGIVGFSKAMTRHKINKILDQAANIIVDVQALFTEQANYQGLDNEVAVEMGAIPEELQTDPSGDLLHSYHGKVYIGASNAYENDPTQQAFYLKFENLPREVCIILATGDWGGVPGSGLIGMEVSGKTRDLTGLSTIVARCDGTKPEEGVDYNEGYAQACVNGHVQAFPMAVKEANRACNCLLQTCSIAWKYM